MEHLCTIFTINFSSSKKPQPAKNFILEAEDGRSAKRGLCHFKIPIPPSPEYLLWESDATARLTALH